MVATPAQATDASTSTDPEHASSTLSRAASGSVGESTDAPTFDPIQEPMASTVEAVSTIHTTTPTMTEINPGLGSVIPPSGNNAIVVPGGIASTASPTGASLVHESSGSAPVPLSPGNTSFGETKPALISPSFFETSVPTSATGRTSLTPTGPSAPRSSSTREKKESRKKREAKGPAFDSSKQGEESYKSPDIPLRFFQEQTLLPIHYEEKPVEFSPVEVKQTLANVTFHELRDYPQDSHRKNWKYAPAMPDDAFPATKFTSTEQGPYYPRFSLHAHGESTVFSEDGLKICCTGGHQSARTNVALKERTFFWEVKVLSSGLQEDRSTSDPREAGFKGGRVRVGIMRGEANHERNVGGDGYGYAIIDDGRILYDGYHAEIPGRPLFRVGDVFGIRITLPPLEVHKKIVEGSYNPAVDGPETWATRPVEPGVPYENVIRDRNPFFFNKGRQPFFEQQSYDHDELQINNSTLQKYFKANVKKVFPDDEMNHLPPNGGYKGGPKDRIIEPNPNHPDPRYRTLPGSKFELWRNGEYLGVMFENMLAFLVPASRLYPGGEDRPAGRQFADDGSLGYYPAVSCYYGGAAEIKLQEPWWYGPPTYGPPTTASTSDNAGPSEGPPTKKTKKGKGKAIASDFPPKPEVLPIDNMMELYDDQIAEQVVWDVIDEASAQLTDEQLQNQATAPIVPTATSTGTEE